MGGQTSFTLASIFVITYNALAPKVRIHIREKPLVEQVQDKAESHFIERHLIPREDVENG